MWGAFYNASSRDPFRGELQLRAVNSILAYMPSTPNFAYHGSAGGWGDFSNNGKWMVRGGWEREGNHYRAGAALLTPLTLLPPLVLPLRLPLLLLVLVHPFPLPLPLPQ